MVVMLALGLLVIHNPNSAALAAPVGWVGLDRADTSVA